jgi:LPXTG-motif cell wall-anchored protein
MDRNMGMAFLAILLVGLMLAYFYIRKNRA